MWRVLAKFISIVSRHLMEAMLTLWLLPMLFEPSLNLKLPRIISLREGKPLGICSLGTCYLCLVLRSKAPKVSHVSILCPLWLYLILAGRQRNDYFSGRDRYQGVDVPMVGARLSWLHSLKSNKLENRKSPSLEKMVCAHFPTGKTQCLRTRLQHRKKDWPPHGCPSWWAVPAWEQEVFC